MAQDNAAKANGEWLRRAFEDLTGRTEPPPPPAVDPSAPPARPPTNAGHGAGMVQPIKKPMTMNQILRKATGR